MGRFKDLPARRFFPMKIKNSFAYFDVKVGKIDSAMIRAGGIVNLTG
jgi:hypothetical protein